MFVQTSDKEILKSVHQVIEIASPEGTFCDTVQVPSGVGDMQLI